MPRLVTGSFSMLQNTGSTRTMGRGSSVLGSPVHKARMTLTESRLTGTGGRGVPGQGPRRRTRDCIYNSQRTCTYCATRIGRVRTGHVPFMPHTFHLCWGSCGSKGLYCTGAVHGCHSRNPSRTENLSSAGSLVAPHSFCSMGRSGPRHDSCENDPPARPWYYVRSLPRESSRL